MKSLFGSLLMAVLLLFSACSDKKVDYNIAGGSVRFATFNASLFRQDSGALIRDMESSDSKQIQTIAEIMQRLRPDVILLNEFDYDEDGVALNNFCKNYLEKNQNGVSTIHYPFRAVFASNTGIPSGEDLNGNGKLGEASDAFGYGKHKGQYGFVLLSRYPIVKQEIRSFNNFLWKDMPGALLPIKENGEMYLSDAALNVFRLSSKNHVDVPIQINGRTIHALISHPTPPVFDGPEDLNGKRNHDEIRFWKDYINNEDYFVDDNGHKGGLAEGESFVIMGDMNADPVDGDSYQNAIAQLLDHEKVNQEVSRGSRIPASDGALEDYRKLDHRNRTGQGNPDYHTSIYRLRIDYVLPSADLEVTGSGVFWPHSREDSHYLVDGKIPSDHRFVWVDFYAVF